MSGTFTSLWVYVLAEVIGGIAAALLYTTVVAGAGAPTTNKGHPQTDRALDDRAPGDRALATGTNTDTADDPA